MNTCPEKYMELLPYQYMHLRMKNRNEDTCAVAIYWSHPAEQYGERELIVERPMYAEMNLDSWHYAMPRKGNGHQPVKDTIYREEIPEDAETIHKWYRVS